MPLDPTIRDEARRRAAAIDGVADRARGVLERVPMNLTQRLAAAFGVSVDGGVDSDDAAASPGDTRVETEIRATEGDDAAQRAAVMRLEPDDFADLVRSAGVDDAQRAWVSGVLEFDPGAEGVAREVIREAIDVEARTLFDTVAQGYGATTNRIVTQAALAGVLGDDDALERALSALPDALPSGNTTTEVVTATARIDRVAQAQNRARLERDGNVVMVYTGPDDKLTRPFCDALVGKGFAPAEVREMNNGQTGGSVEVDCGGYNCRHMWVTVDAEDADALGVDEGDASDVAAANAAGRRARRGR